MRQIIEISTTGLPDLKSVSNYVAKMFITHTISTLLLGRTRCEFVLNYTEPPFDKEKARTLDPVCKKKVFSVSRLAPVVFAVEIS